MLSKISYYLFIYPISKLPYPLLYLIADFLFVVMYYVAGYRKKVILSNIQHSFPEKTDKEHKEIMRGFYRHFCDFILESIKCFTISEEESLKRFKLTNPEVINQFYDKGQDVIFTGGHYNNWEILAVSIGLQIKTLPLGIYKPLSNPFFDKKMRETREKYRLKLCPTYQVDELIRKDYGKPKGTIFAVDQSPSNPKKGYWMMFLHQETPILFGTEKYAKELNLPVLFCEIKKIKRGHYTGTFRVLCETPQETPYGLITQLCTKAVEKQIQKEPQYWLWSHKRWKHKRPIDMPLHEDFDFNKFTNCNS